METGLKKLAEINHDLATPLNYLTLLPQNFEDLTAAEYNIALESINAVAKIYREEREMIQAIVRENEVGRLPISSN